MTNSLLADGPATVNVDQKLASLLEEAAQKIQRGESIDLDHLSQEHPSHADALRELLPTVAAMVAMTNSSADKAPSLSGTLGKYQLMAKLGEGGMGAVYMALHTDLQKTVALKLLPANRMNDPGALARFRREMKALGRFDHDHIVRASDAGEENGTHFLVMEYVEGCDLARLVRRLGPLPIADACRIIMLAAEGLEFAHNHGLIHRDIKPSNIMLTPQGQIKILDLGLALLHELTPAGPELTNTGQLIGTIDYMAPEQGSNSHSVDARVDVYSLGATLYQLLIGSAPFAGAEFDTLMKKMNAVASQPARSLSELRPEVSQELSAIVTRMLAKNPADRFSSAAEVATALEPFTHGHNLPALLHQPATPAPPRPANAWSISTSNQVHSGTTPSIAAPGSPDSQPQPPHSPPRKWPMVAAAFFGAAVMAGVFLIVRDNSGHEKLRASVDKNDTIEIIQENAPPAKGKAQEHATTGSAAAAADHAKSVAAPTATPASDFMVYLGCGTTGSPGAISQVSSTGQIIGSIMLNDPPNGLVVRDGSLVVANASPIVGGGQMLTVRPDGQLDRLEWKKQFPAPIALALARNSKDMLVADNEEHKVYRVIYPTNDAKLLFPAPLDADQDHFPNMSVAETTDGHLLFSASDPKGVFRLTTSDEKLPKPVLAEDMAVAAQPGTNRWVAMNHSDLRVFDGDKEQPVIHCPPGSVFWHYKIMSFGPDGRLFVVLQTGRGFEIQSLSLDDKKFTPHFVWKEQQIQSMAVGPPVRWKQNTTAK